MNFDIYQTNKFLKNFLIHVFLLAVSLTCLFPLLWMFRSALMTNQTIFTDKSLIPAEVHWENFTTAWSEGGFGVYFINSVVYTLSVVVGIVLIASLAAYAFSRLKFPGRNALFLMFVIAMMIPLPGSFVPLVVLMNKLGLADTRIGYILCMINVGLIISILILKTFFDKMPQDLEDAARVEGCNPFQIWWHVALPFAQPAIAVVVMFNSLNVWNEYVLALLLLSDTSKMPLQKGIMAFAGSHSVDYPVYMAGLTITAVPIILFYLAMQKVIHKGMFSRVLSG